MSDTITLCELQANDATINIGTGKRLLGEAMIGAALGLRHAGRYFLCSNASQQRLVSCFACLPGTEPYSNLRLMSIRAPLLCCSSQSQPRPLRQHQRHDHPGGPGQQQRRHWHQHSGERWGGWRAHCLWLTYLGVLAGCRSKKPFFWQNVSRLRPLTYLHLVGHKPAGDFSGSGHDASPCARLADK